MFFLRIRCNELLGCFVWNLPLFGHELFSLFRVENAINCSAHSELLIVRMHVPTSLLFFYVNLHSICYCVTSYLANLWCWKLWFVLTFFFASKCSLKFSTRMLDIYWTCENNSTTKTEVAQNTIFNHNNKFYGSTQTAKCLSWMRISIQWLHAASTCRNRTLTE